MLFCFKVLNCFKSTMQLGFRHFEHSVFKNKWAPFLPWTEDLVRTFFSRQTTLFQPFLVNYFHKKTQLYRLQSKKTEFFLEDLKIFNRSFATFFSCRESVMLNNKHKLFWSAASHHLSKLFTKASVGSWKPFNKKPESAIIQLPDT